MARTSAFSKEQIAKIVAETEASTLAEVSKKHGVSIPTLSKWRREAGKTGKTGKRASGAKSSKRVKTVAQVQGIDLATLADDLQLAAMVRAFIESLGYVKRK